MEGVHDPMSLVLALVLNAQLRAHQGPSTWWAFGDVRWAFDVARVAGMLVACFDASVCGARWLLLDDILTMDSQCLHLHGLLSVVFVLGVGTAQGKRFSVHVFNSLLRM